ncbi:hypothetical protein JJB07_14615 [Tumebacillus sp. ITR2]|uniref:Uncharacterized protein n=1 Tax=Tumebacillus amylolyticus TaxID=2801339 RepID=A0ABS1JC71_9BACL|nr:hypothetical protein [Tumebacillus amylolyticus]MBL0387871.1 hypothetical protein [Tumebacillus amylolyticus]
MLNFDADHLRQISLKHAMTLRLDDAHYLLRAANEIDRLQAENRRLIASRTAKNITSSQLIELLQETLFDDSEIGVSEEYTGTGVGVALWVADPLVAKAILDAADVGEDGEPNV